jgi:hypothetical protein
MHITALTPALISDCAALSVRAFIEDEVFEFLRPRGRLYPDHWRKYYVQKLHKQLNTPGFVTMVAMSDSRDQWYNESVGSEVMGVAEWERKGVKWDEDVWGRDGLGKCELVEFIRFRWGSLGMGENSLKYRHRGIVAWILIGNVKHSNDMQPT